MVGGGYSIFSPFLYKRSISISQFNGKIILAFYLLVSHSPIRVALVLMLAYVLIFKFNFLESECCKNNTVCCKFSGNVFSMLSIMPSSFLLYFFS